MPLNDIESDVLDEVYFVTAFADIVRATGFSTETVKEGMGSLLRQEYVQQLRFNSAIGDFEKMDEPDTVNLNEYHYLATKQGLLAHNLNG